MSFIYLNVLKVINKQLLITSHTYAHTHTHVCMHAFIRVIYKVRYYQSFLSEDKKLLSYRLQKSVIFLMFIVSIFGKQLLYWHVSIEEHKNSHFMQTNKAIQLYLIT